MKKACAICGITNELVLIEHHVIPRKDGGTDDPTNLVCLCRNCHALVHNGYYKLTSRFTPLERKVMAQVLQRNLSMPMIAFKIRKDQKTVSRALSRIALKLLCDETIRGLIAFTTFSKPQRKEELKEGFYE